MTVLASYVPTAEGGEVLEAALHEARLRHCPLEVLNVALGSDFADPTFADERDLDAVRTRLIEAGVPHHVRQITQASNVAEIVLSVAAAVDASLIVVGLHRRSPTGMAVLGSTAQRVMLSAHCPVLTVRASVQGSSDPRD
jgi:nucleotide-binding universal stress UspA family protein